jgi:hypothetical protein
MPRMLPHLLLLLMAALSACAGGGPAATGQTTAPPQARAQQSPEEALRARATQFWEARLKGDLAAQYEFLEPGAREQMTLTAFVRSRGAIVFLSYQLEEVEVVGDQGRVLAKVSFRMDLPQVSRFGPWTQTPTMRWVLVRDIWYLKGSQQDADKPLKTE